MSIYGSVHTHFEDRYDTGNDNEQMVRKFIDLGAKRVAVTGHGVFSAYEDLRDIVSSIKKDAKKKGEEVPDFEIIPGIEAYLPEHCILIAKDYEGYLSLCKIISESNENIQNGKPIVTFKNLRKNVKKGHLFCTSACIAGPFGKLFGLEECNLNRKIEKLESELNHVHFYEMMDILNEYEAKKVKHKAIYPRQTEITAAKRELKKGNELPTREIEARTEKANELASWIEKNTEKYNEAVAGLKKIKKGVYVRKDNQLQEYKQRLSELKEDKANGFIEQEAYNLLQTFLDIFGEQDFYFEIQNHGIPEEQIIYNKVISFAYQAGHPHFIASNDIHIGTRKSDPDYEDLRLRRNIMKFTRFNTYEEETLDDKEYTIKEDAELREMLLQSIKDVDTGLEIIPASQIIDEAIGNIEQSLSECNIEFPKGINHYPKFCEDENAEFEKKVREGIKTRFPDGFPDSSYQERLEYELGVIKTMGYAGYHLIVADYLTYGRLLGYLRTQEEIENAPLTIEELDKYITERGYPRIGYSIGPGRGSAVGSLCCYLLGITDIDPIPYGLLFERKTV